MALRRMAFILLIFFLTAGATASEGVDRREPMTPLRLPDSAQKRIDVRGPCVDGSDIGPPCVYPLTSHDRWRG